MLGQRQLIRFFLPGLVVIAGCGGGHGETAVAKDMHFGEAVSSGYSIPQDGDGIAVSLGVVNRSKRKLSITNVRVQADPGLAVEYVGWATCLKGCFGTAAWPTVAREMAEGRMVPDGKLPVPLVPSGKVGGGGFSPASLEFRVILDPAHFSDPDRCFAVQRVLVDLASGEKAVPITTPDGDVPVLVEAGRLDDRCDAKTGNIKAASPTP